MNAKPGHGSDEPWVRRLFLQSLELRTTQERQTLLAEACGGDTALKTKVEALLRSHREDGFLEQPADEARSPLGRSFGALVFGKPGDFIGRYKLLEKIGEGGSGVVYVAEQHEPVRRRVALKIIKLGMDTRSVVARFEAERQALAMMDHPNIAKVLDAGATENGRPFFVMELVRGIRITDDCDQNRLSTAERLDLFLHVCRAVQHAHQKGIIHCDLKPSNILVTVNDPDASGCPKVIDFGIAKATEGRLTDKTVYTELHQFIGTPAYMSPEQAEMTSLDIDTRSDIYSLGVLLYELVTAPAIFVAPQLNPAYGGWNDVEPQLVALLAALSKNYPVDTNRLYITGLSLGGIGAWGLLADYPKLFAAAVPMSGSGNPGAASIFRNVPVWDFHSRTDETVPVSGSEDMIQALRAVGGTPIYTEYATGGHVIWAQAYSTPGLVEWTMAQSRLAPGTADPRITITAPTTNAFYATHASSLSLAGTASAGGAGILSVDLANLTGAGSTSVLGTNTWSATSALVSGKTNLLQFIGTTTSWAPDLGGSTTFAQDFTLAANIPLTLSMTAQSQSLTLRWSGGIPPYSVQTTDDLTAANWVDLLTNGFSPFSIPIQSHQAFFRIQGQ